MITLGDVGGVRLTITGDNCTCPSLYLTAFTNSVLTICPPLVVEIAEAGLSISYDLPLSLPSKRKIFKS